jgi:hypothetical protein
MGVPLNGASQTAIFSLKDIMMNQWTWGVPFAKKASKQGSHSTRILAILPSAGHTPSQNRCSTLKGGRLVVFVHPMVCDEASVCVTPVTWTHYDRYIYIYQPIQFCQPSELKQLAFHRSPQYKCCWMNPWFLLGKSTFHRWFSLRFQGALGPSLTAHVSGHLLHQCSTQQAGWSHAFPAHAGEAPKRGASWKSAAALIFRIGWWENWNRNSHLMVKTMVSG